MKKEDISYNIISVTGNVPMKQQIIQRVDEKKEQIGMPDVETVNDKHKWYKKLYKFNKK